MLRRRRGTRVSSRSACQQGSTASGCWRSRHQFERRSARRGFNGHTNSIAFVTYLINVPLNIFCGGHHWPRLEELSTRWVPRVAIAFAIAAIFIDLGLARPGAASVANSWLVLILICYALGHAFQAPTIGRAHTY